MISPKSTLSCKEADERLDVGLFVTASPGLMGSWLLLAQWIKGMLPPAHAGGRELGYLIRKITGRF